MPDLGPHAAFIWAAYAVTFVAVAGLVGLIVQDDRRQRQLLADLERQGITRRQSRHVMTNVLIELTGPDTASGTVYLVNFRHDSQTGMAEKPAPADAPKFVGDYHLTFRRVGGTWYLHTLDLDLAFLRRSGRA